MSYKEGGYVVSSGGYYSGGAMDMAWEPLKLLVPGVAYAREHKTEAPLTAQPWRYWLGVLVAVLFLIFFVSSVVAMSKSGFQGMAGKVQTLGQLTPWGGAPGAAGTSTIKLSDPYHDAGSKAKAADTFLGGSVGPEFVEQPNYVLGQEDMLRTALNNFARLKAKGLAGNWSDYWKQYQADHADDLSASLYDFGDGFEGIAGRTAPLPVAATLNRALRA